jgi:hypothetical protein
MPNEGKCIPARSEAKANRLVCPVNFHPETLLDSRDAKLAAALVYLAHAIIMRGVRAPRSIKDGFVPLQSTILKGIMGHRVWPRVRRLALDVGLIECDDSYRAGVRSKGYRLKEPYRSAKWEWRPIRDGPLAERLARRRKAGQRRTPEDGCRGGDRGRQESIEHLRRQIRRIRIDAVIDEPLTSQSELAIELIRQGDWRCEPDDFGRVHSNITNLKKTLRKHLSVDGRRLVNCDVANSQPLFLGMLLLSGQPLQVREGEDEEGMRGGRREGAGKGTLCGARNLCGARQTRSNELREYLAICEQGQFYQRVASHLDTELPYETLKRRALAALYDRPWRRNRAHSAISTAFPAVMAALAEIKRRDYHRAAQMMQRQESDFIIGQCVGRLARECPTLFITTVHDSIVTTEGNEEIVRSAMLEEFALLGVRPTIKVERYCN